MKLSIIVRTIIATSIMEYLNSYGKSINYIFTKPDYFEGREVSVFLVEGSQEDLEVIKNYFHHIYESSSVLPQLYLQKEDMVG